MSCPFLRGVARFDQSFELMQGGRLAGSGRVLRPLHAAVVRATEQIQVTVTIPVDDERIAVRALDDTAFCQP